MVNKHTDISMNWKQKEYLGPNRQKIIWKLERNGNSGAGICFGNPEGPILIFIGMDGRSDLRPRQGRELELTPRHKDWALKWLRKEEPERIGA